jgi:hypothetical protein
MNPVWEFEYPLEKKWPYLFRVTSVSGHILESKFKNKTEWKLEEVEKLFEDRIEW